LFDILGTSGSGLRTYRTWLDAISDNIANVNTAKRTSENAFQTRYVQAEAIEDGEVGRGVRVAGIVKGSAEGRMVHEPDNPLADENGYVRYPDVDLGEQMSHLLLAQRGYQANIAVVERAQQAYQSALTIGKS
jgi:flagellar basal-body rod protein FlgC